MKYRIKKSEEREEKVVEFWLQRVKNTIVVRAKKEGSARDWSICGISEEGLKIYTGVREDLGFPLDGSKILFSPRE